MIWGDQWKCKCGTANLELRARCRWCGLERPADAPTATAIEVMNKAHAAEESQSDGGASGGEIPPT